MKFGKYLSVCWLCGEPEFCTYVKTHDGFRKVCLKCADEMLAKGLLEPEERVVAK